MAALEKDALDNQIENFKYATSLIKLILAVTAVVIFMFSRHAFIFFSAAILPAITVIFSDKGTHKCASATICTFNLMGVTPYLRELWHAHSIDDAAREIISDPIAWLMIYSTAFVGFLIYITLPAIIAQMYVAKANIRIATLVGHRNRICTEWDIKLEEETKEESF